MESRELIESRVEEGQANILCSQRQFLDTCSEDLQISHMYSIVNEGRIDVNRGSFLIYWPMYSSSEHFILSYESLSAFPDENVKCAPIWDQRQFKARNSSIFNEHLDKSGAVDYVTRTFSTSIFNIFLELRAEWSSNLRHDQVRH